jgi:hypothetical protein
MTGARLLYRRVSNHLQFDGATSLTMAMAARRKSSQILDNSNTGNVSASATSLTTTACNALANSLIQRRLWVGSWVVACWSWHLPLGRVPKFGSGTKKMKRSNFSREGIRNLILFYKSSRFSIFFKSIVPRFWGNEMEMAGCFFSAMYMTELMERLIWGLMP